MNRRSYIAIGITLFIMLSLCPPASAQNDKVHWLTFEQLEDSLAVKPKQVFIDFYTDWCAYCRKMDRLVFTNSEIAALLNSDYYAVRFNAESDSAINFGSRQFVNDQIGRSRSPIHQIAQLLALRDGHFVAPTLVVLDETFRVTARYFEYMSSRRLLAALQ